MIYCWFCQICKRKEINRFPFQNTDKLILDCNLNDPRTDVGRSDWCLNLVSYSAFYLIRSRRGSRKTGREGERGK